MRRALEALISLALPILLTGCASSAATWQAWTGVPPSATNSSEPSTPSAKAAPSIEQPERHEASAPSQEHDSDSTNVNSEEKPARTSIQPTPVVTLGDSDGAQATTDHAINSVSSDLMRVNRNSLQPADLSVYNQANSFIEAARKAMASKDYAAANGFAQKASALTSKLVPKPNGP
jgi:hypothetical protein